MESTLMRLVRKLRNLMILCGHLLSLCGMRSKPKMRLFQSRPNYQKLIVS
ncbi:hypothetical protein LINPERHAP1_LOCUS17598, partial [Linum perenne]